MNTELIKQASGKVPNPNILVNLVSKRIRSLTQGSRPLIEAPPPGTSSMDIALQEIAEERITWTSAQEQTDIED